MITVLNERNPLTGLKQRREHLKAWYQAGINGKVF